MNASFPLPWVEPLESRELLTSLFHFAYPKEGRESDWSAALAVAGAFAGTVMDPMFWVTLSAALGAGVHWENTPSDERQTLKTVAALTSLSALVGIFNTVAPSDLVQRNASEVGAQVISYFIAFDIAALTGLCAFRAYEVGRGVAMGVFPPTSSMLI